MLIHASYNLFLVALSFIIAVFGSYTSLQLMHVIRLRPQQARNKWIYASALCLGGTIWSMHFIGMIAYNSEIEIAYALGPTLASLIIAVVLTGLGINIFSKAPDSNAALAAAGFITALGITSMHYMGMEAMIMAGTMHYRTDLLILSILIAIIAATIALYLAFKLENGSHKFIAAIAMGLAVCGMHYTGMAAMSMKMDMERIINLEPGISPMTLGLVVFCISTLLLACSLTISLNRLHQHMYEEVKDKGNLKPLDPN
ncbi:MHYT domain-containing protein [Agaribacterium sp. ZY112]|uniref:MHYT domain-containing protein n=1 Tax=Agaribacterium sp. ZY112 TaxID=3233574 RepID=UPI0035242808